MFNKHPVVNKSIYKLSNNIPDDCVGIRGKIYKIYNFNHPGGNTFLEINKGCDITSLYETHHVNIEESNKELKKLKVWGYYEPVVNYDFNFYNNLRTDVFSLFTTKKSRMMNFSTKLNLIFYIIIGVYAHYKLLKYNYDNINIYFIPLCIISALINSILGGFGHNGLHRLLYSTLLLDWNGLSTIEWLLEHAHSHHMYTNTIYDHDSISMQPFLNWIPSKNNSIFNNYGKHLIFLIAELAVSIQGNILHKFRWSILFNKKFPLWIRLSPLIFMIRIWTHILYQGFIFGIFNLILCLSFASYYFSYMAHLNHVNIRNKNHDNLNNVCFIDHQIKNTNDLKINNYLSHIFLNLNKQKVHHLFPTIDHSNLRKIYNMIQNSNKFSNINLKATNINTLNTKMNNMLNLFSFKLI